MGTRTTRVLFIANSYPNPPQYLGGADTLDELIVKELRKRGRDVHVLTTDLQGTGNPKDDRIKRALRATVRLGENGALSSRSRSDRLIGQLTGFMTTMGEIRRLKPDVVMAGEQVFVPESVFRALQIARTPVLLYVYTVWLRRRLSAKIGGHQKSGLRKRLRSWLLTPSLEWFNDNVRLVFSCDRLKKELQALGVSTGNAPFVANGVDLERFYPRPDAQPHTPFRFLYVGRIAPDRSTHLLVEAFGKYCQLDRVSEATLTLCRGHLRYVSYEAAVESVIKQYGIESKVQIIAPHRSEMPNVYWAHDALIFPTGPEEPLSWTPIEALVSGTPLLASCVGGIAEIIEHERNGLTFEYGDVEEMKRQMVRIVVDTEIRSKIRNNALAEREHFSIEAMIDKLDAVLLETVE